MRRADLRTTLLLAALAVATVPAYDVLFDDPAWRGPTLVATALALATCALVRALRWPSVLAVLLALPVALSTVPWLVGQAATPVLPGPTAWAGLAQLFASAPELIAETPAPVPALAPLVLVVLLAWWIVVHAAHDLAVRLRQPGMAVVSLAVLWAVPLAIVGADGVRTGVVAPFLAVGMLTLLLTNHQVVGTERTRPRGLLVAVGATSLALLAPSVAPGVFTPDSWLDLGGDARPRGYQPIVDVSQRLGLPEERDVLRVRASQRSYLRLAGLDHFDGATWRLGSASDGGGTYRPDPDRLFRADGLLPPEQPAAATQTVLMDIEVLDLENIYVPVPYQPVEILGPIREEMVWSTEGGFLATWETVDVLADGEPRIGIREGVAYRVQAARPAPTLEELQAVDHGSDLVAAALQLPRDYPELGALAEDIYADAGADTVVDQALALQDWFIGPEGGFTYDLGVPALRGDDALTRFVLEDRVGYCEYFATAMAVMLRETGIPARVAVGFLPGRVTQEPDPAAGVELTEYTVSTADAHAWVEVLFPGYGWITFEPTPRDDDSHMLPTGDDLAPIQNVAEQRADGDDELLDDQQPTPEGDPTTDDVPTPDDASATPGSGPDDEDAAGTVGEVRLGPWLVAFVAALLSFALLARGRRRRAATMPDDPVAAVLLAQRQLLAQATRLGIGRRAHETLPEATTRWAAEGRIDALPAEVPAAVQAAAFGGTVAADDAATAWRALSRASGQLRATASPRERNLAPLRGPWRRLRTTGRVLQQGATRVQQRLGT